MWISRKEDDEEKVEYTNSNIQMKEYTKRENDHKGKCHTAYVNITGEA